MYKRDYSLTRGKELGAGAGRDNTGEGLDSARRPRVGLLWSRG